MKRLERGWLSMALAQWLCGYRPSEKDEPPITDAINPFRQRWVMSCNGQPHDRAPYYSRQPPRSVAASRNPLDPNLPIKRAYSGNWIRMDDKCFVYLAKTARPAGREFEGSPKARYTDCTRSFDTSVLIGIPSMGRNSLCMSPCAVCWHLSKFLRNP